jgi:hypothetical protein
MSPLNHRSENVQSQLGYWEPNHRPHFEGTTIQEKAVVSSNVPAPTLAIAHHGGTWRPQSGNEPRTNSRKKVLVPRGGIEPSPMTLISPSFWDHHHSGDRSRFHRSSARAIRPAHNKSSRRRDRNRAHVLMQKRCRARSFDVTPHVEAVTCADPANSLCL